MKQTLPSLNRPLPPGWSLHFHENFAHLCLVEPNLSSAVAQNLGEALTDLKAQGFYRVLLEDGIQNWSLSTSHILLLLEAMRQFEFFEMRVVMLSPFREHYDDLRFLETAAVNRGYEVRAFFEVGPGLSWLLEANEAEGKSR